MKGLIPTPVTMSSREIAELTGKDHKNVVRDVRVMLQELALDRLSFERIYKDSMNRDQTEYLLDRELTETLLTGYSIPLRRRVIARLHELEQQQTPRLPQNFAEALRLAADQAEQIEQQQMVIEQQAPKVEALRILSEAEGSVCITLAAKELGMKPGKLFAWMRANRWLYRRSDNGPYVAYQPRIDSGHLCHKVEAIPREGKPDKLFEQVRVTPKGLAKLAQLVGGDE
jgi:phage antirepressor YoqD-like protein